MADVLLTAAGQAIGSAFGGPIGAAIGGAIGGAIGQTFTPTQKFQGPRLGDLRVTGTEYGQTIPWVAGAPRISGQIIWASAKREIANTQKQGKGGGGGSQSTTYTYEVDVAYLLTENEIPGVARIWSNGELVGAQNGTVATGNWFIDGVLELTGQIQTAAFKEIRIYTGTDDQMPDSLIEASVGVGNTPAYRGRGYVVIRGLQLGQSGQLPNLTFEIGIGGVIPTEGIGFLNNFEEFTTPGVSIKSDVGPDLFRVGETDPPLALDTDVKRFGLSALEYRLQPIIARNISLDLAGKSWRIEGWLRKDQEFGIVFRLINTQTGVTINFQHRSVGGVYGLQITGTSNWVSGGILNGNLGNLWPTDNDFHHFAVQFAQRNTNSVLSFYTDGILLAQRNAPSGNPDFLTGQDWDLEFGRAQLTGQNSSYDSVVFKIINDLEEYPVDVDFVTPGGSVNDFDPVIFFIPPNAAFTDSTILPVTAWYDAPEDPERLKRITDDLMLRAGYNLNQYDIDLLPSYDVKAIALSQVSGTRAPLELLQSATFFEAAKDDKIRFFARKTSAVVTIPYSDLGFSFDGGDQEQFVLTNSNDLELPAQIAVQYANMEADYQAGTEFSDRILSEQESTNVVQLALGLLPEQAKVIVDKMLSDLIAGQWRFTIKLPLKYAYLMPGDVFNVIARDGRSFRSRIQTKKDSQVLIELECTLDDVGTLDVDAATDANYVSQRDIRAIALTEWEAMDIPLLRDADNNVSWYGAITPVSETDTKWPGGVLVQSFSPPAYTQLYTTGDISAIGECETTLGNWPHGAMFDETNKLTVTLYAGELESVARADMLLDQELNAAAVGVDGQWELIRFRNAELTGQTSTGLNIYRLSGLLRGQRGTEWAIGLHGANERFVLLDTTIRNIPSQLNELNLERFIKGATTNSVLDDITERSFTHTGVSLKPFSVAQLRALPDGSDIEVTWNRRTRLSYRYSGINPVVPLGEASELYRVWIYDGSTLVRTEDVTTDSYTYSAADIASDGFVSTDTIRIEVAQVSAIVGAGYIEEVEVIAP
jgi:hypothetical protein